jgi:hypothetical protein
MEKPCLVCQHSDEPITGKHCRACYRPHWKPLTKDCEACWYLNNPIPEKCNACLTLKPNFTPIVS